MASLQTLTTTFRLLLAFELLLGGQCRVTDVLTPSLSARAYSKADGYRRYLWMIPSRNSKQHTQIIGVLMLAAGVALLLPRTRTWERVRAVGKALALALPLMGVYSQWAMGVPYWLPIVNSVLAGVITYGERRV